MDVLREAFGKQEIKSLPLKPPHILTALPTTLYPHFYFPFDASSPYHLNAYLIQIQDFGGDKAYNFFSTLGLERALLFPMGV